MSSPRTVLVVEDNPLTRKMLRITLESEGYEVIEAADGRAALAAAAQKMPALVLQDLILPDINGFELVRQLRALPHGAETPILALSGFVSRIEEARTSQSGFTALLVKPIEPSRLLETIKPFFPDRARGAPAGAGRRLLLVDDDPIQLKLTRIQLEQIGFAVVAASSTEEALRLARAQPPDIVLADVLMPDLDGYHLCSELRRDPELARIPVVLESAWYQTDADKDLAKRVGASALVLRTPELDAAAEALFAALREGAPAPSEESSLEVQLEHAKAVIRQLGNQLAISRDLGRRCAFQAAQISLLGGVADVLSPTGDMNLALCDFLAATLDAAGISKGALFLRDERGVLVVRHAIGFTPSEQAGLTTFFGQLALLEDVVDRQAAVPIPSASLSAAVSKSILAHADVASAHIVPLVSKGRSAGAILLAAKNTDVTGEDSISFARAMGSQLAQSLELARSIARLSASEQRYRTVTESANDAICILTPEGIILEGNRSLEQAVGLPREELIGRNIRELAEPGDHDTAESSGTSLESPPSSRARRLLRRPDGSVVQMEFSNKHVDVAGERLVFSIARDVTEQVQAQAQLMASDRMASIGMLASGVAHEINNPLAAVVANLDCAARDVAALIAKERAYAELPSLVEEIGDARDAAARMRDIVNDLRIFSRAEDENSGPVDVRRVMDSSLRIAWSEIRHRARLVKEYGDAPNVAANESRLGQVFLNLLVNAAQAMPEGSADRNALSIKTGFDQESSRVFAEVSDTGSGMSPETLKRLFTPFFTTKPRGIGTGLGLAICHRIVAALGGQIEVDSAIGKGTRFRVLLPASQIRTPAPKPIVSDSATRRRGRILIVDDEVIIINCVKRLLSDHDVIGVTDASKALDWFARGERFDVVLCDLMMPVLTGMDFYQELMNRGDDHAARIVFLTGGVFNQLGRDFLARPSIVHVDKPFESRSLRALINERVSS